jgi:hypothetical protein
MPDYGPPGTGGVCPAARAAFEQLLTDLFDHQGVSHAEAEEFITARRAPACLATSNCQQIDRLWDAKRQPVQRAPESSSKEV